MKDNEVRRMSEKSEKDVQVLNTLLNNGWKYCAKSVWKKATRNNEALSETSAETRKEKKSKKEKTTE
jgi:hypothetical protein